MTARKRTARRDAGHPTPGPHGASGYAMHLLKHLWNGALLDLTDDVLYLVVTHGREKGRRCPLPVGLLDDLEFARKWVWRPEVGRRVMLTRAGLAALAGWLADAYPGNAAAENQYGERLTLPGKEATA